MAKISDAAAKFVRSVFARERQKSELAVTTRDLISTARGGMFGSSIDVSGIGGVGEALGLDRRMLYRYGDYEEMDDYGDISSALDIYSDDATQVDSASQHTVWVESQDKRIKEELEDMFWKRLGIEDEIWSITRTLCILEGSFVWTSEGPKRIEDVQPGDMVQSYDEHGRQIFTPVKKVWSTGERDVWRVRTKHRELRATANHPVLTQKEDGTTEWIKVEDLIMRRHPGGAIDLNNTSKIMVSLSMPSTSTDVPEWKDLIGEPSWSNVGTPNDLKLPGRMTEQFARLMGFMWGDGFMGNIDLSSTSTSIMFSVGEYEEQNEFYDDCFRSLGLSPARNEDAGTSTVCSVRLKDIMLRLGWKNGASNKKIPKWLGLMPWGHRKAFLDGFIDADGWSTQQSTWTRSAIHFEIANVEMARELKALIDGLGFRSGHLRIRKRIPGFRIKGKVVKTTEPTATLTYSEYKYDPGFIAERLNSVEKFGRGRVWDLEVDNSAHNFVVDGVVVHNCKYGNDYEEIVVSDRGVVDLRFMPPATVRRVESSKGDLLGFVQSYSGDISVSPKEFEEMKLNTGAAIGPGKDVAAYEDWRVSHMRLRSKHRDSLYGWSITEPARWVWKRLMLLEDAVLVYKLCLRGDSQIWTPVGCKAIRDLEEGDEVYSYTTEDKLKKTKVVYKKHNGKDLLYRIKSSHRELYANATHPVLVETLEKGGKGVPRVRRMDYVEAQDLIPGVHRLVTPFKEDELCEQVSLVIPETGQKARLSKKALEDGVKMEVGVRRLQDNCGMQADLVKQFFAGEYEVVAHTARKVLAENGTPEGYLDVRDDWGGAKKVSLPRVVTPDFARWFGFMIGDGFASERPFTRDDKVYLVREVGFASGDKDEVNTKYASLFESFFGEVAFGRDKRSRHEGVGRYSIESKALYEFMLLNGFIPGAHNKRVPEWVFKSPAIIRQSFLEGLADADGHIQEGGVSEVRNRVRHRRFIVELCNEALVNDIRELAMQTGFKVTRVTSRIREGGREILDNGFTLKERTSYTVAWSGDRQPMTEVLHSVEEVEVDDIWDIGVEADEHNFVANGVVVHNTRSPSRYAFYVDVGKLPRQEAERAVQEVMQRLKKKKFVNPKTGKLDLKFNPLAMDEDFFLAMRDGKESTRVESLMGPSYQQVEDVQYFLHKLYAALKIPRAYLGYDENMPSKATLSQEDVRFARTILRVQREVKNGLTKVARVNLAARNIDPSAVDFTVNMTVPSAIFELGQMEVRRARADLASMMERHVSLNWLLSNIYGLSDDEIEEIAGQKKDEQKAMGGSPGGGGFESYQMSDLSRLLSENRGKISERELFKGNKEDEKRIEESMLKAMQDPNNPFGRQMRETGMLVREILHSLKSR